MVIKHPAAQAVDQIHDKSSEILKGIKSLLEEHGVAGFDIGQIKLLSKSGVALHCPPGTSKTFECVTLPNGDVECRWVCK